MSALAHATLTRLRQVQRTANDKPAKPVEDGDPLAVQFNPATLKISRKNNVDRGGVTTQTQKRQHPAQEAATLSFDLEFDTSEQGTTAARVSVRQWTALVRQFVEPHPDRPTDPPPAVRFRWGTFSFDGIIDQVTEDLDHFAPDGTPLRAKVAVSIAEQNFQYEANEQGAGAKTADNATPPGTASPGASPGSSGTDRPQRVVEAQGGESAAQLLARQGLDPEAWRGAMRDVDDPLSLPAGTPVQLGPEVSSGGRGIGLSAGFAAGSARTSVAALSAALGAAPPAGQPAPGGPGPAATAAAGFALAAAGGVAAAAAAVRRAEVQRRTVQATASFAVPTPSAGAGPGPTGAVPGSADPVDERSLTYGRGVPLRARAHAPTLADAAAGGGRSLAARARPSGAPPSRSGGEPWASPARTGVAWQNRASGDARVTVPLDAGRGYGRCG